jgi:hypothetical protein
MLIASLDGKKIRSTDPAWQDRKEEYRSICNARAVCAICQERILCKFGDINIHHFAHQHNANCPGNQDTEEHMLGKNILYEFLVAEYGHEASIELEHYFPEVNIICDILVEFKDGRTWAVEFYCGGKGQDINKKIDYYYDQRIRTTWLLSKNMFVPFEKSKAVKIQKKVQEFITKTGIDKYYIGDWYTQIVVNKRRVPLPRDHDSLGTIMYFDVENREMTILRALLRGSHYNEYCYGGIIKGLLDSIVIKYKEKWGFNWYFEQEKEGIDKYKKAGEVLKQLQQQEKPLKIDHSPRIYRNKYSAYASYASDIPKTPAKEWKEDNKVVFPEKYRCIECGNEYSFGGMSIIPHANEPIGTCSRCVRSRSGGRNLD